MTFLFFAQFQSVGRGYWQSAK